jgi:transglutaminase-like putative cysteine protease
MRWDIQHITRYEYAAPVRDSFNELRLRPLSNGQQKVEEFDLKITPVARLRQYHDFYSNVIHHFDIVEPHSTLVIESRVKVETFAQNLLGFEARPADMSRVKEALRGERAYDFILGSRYVDISPELWRMAVDATNGEQDIWQCAVRLMRFVHSHLTYESKSTTVHTHMRDVLAEKRGVCQDFAHVLLGLCRSLKIPALYVSGYLATEVASATHAWTEVYVPGVGWQGLDPTHNSQPDETYVKIGVGRDYADVPPVSGTYKGTTERKMSVDVKVSRAG